MSEENQNESPDMQDTPKSCCSSDACKSTCKIMSIITTVIITAVLVGGGVYFWQNSKAPVTPTTPTVKTDATTKTPVITPEVKDLTTDVSNAKKLTCTDKWSEYESDNVSFCYKNEWGKPELNYVNKKEQFRLVFIKTGEKGANNDAPEIWWVDNDFEPEVMGGSDWFGDHEKIDFSKSEKEILSLFNGLGGFKEGKSTLTKTTVGDKKAIRIHYDYTRTGMGTEKVDKLGYIAPYAFGNYYFDTRIGYKNAADLDAFVKNIIFTDTKDAKTTDTKTFSNYIKDVSESIDKKFDPSGWETVYTAKGVYNPCSADPAGVCGNDVAILAKKDWDKTEGKQTFYLKHYHKNPATITTIYRGPFTDDVNRILKEAKELVSKLPANSIK